jgi:hypothetical protein
MKISHLHIKSNACSWFDHGGNDIRTMLYIDIAHPAAERSLGVRKHFAQIVLLMIVFRFNPVLRLSGIAKEIGISNAYLSEMLRG